jgi:hypothetical protein
MNLVDHAQRLLRQRRDAVTLLKRSPIEFAVVLVAVVAFALSSGLLPIPDPISDSLTNLLDRAGLSGIREALPAVLFMLAGVLLAWVVWRLWRRAVATPPPADSQVHAAAIKGPMAFTEQDGALFRRLGRESELSKLVGLVRDEQIGLAVVMGESGAGKTSLLRAGLSNALGDQGIGFLYWETLPTAPAEGLLKAAAARWQRMGSEAEPRSLDDLLAPPAGDARRAIVLDQFEQLHLDRPDHQPIFDLLRRIATEQSPPHRTTWLIAFREEYASVWWKFQNQHGFHLPMLPIERFSPAQAGAVIATLAEESAFEVDQALVDAMIRDTSREERVSPVDIGIGMMMLDELARGRDAKHLTKEDYQGIAGGSEGLLTDYIAGRLRLFPEPSRDPLLKAMLGLADLDNNRRVAEGLTAQALAPAAGVPQVVLSADLDYLASPNFRLLEKASPAPDAPPLYRLPHERMVPALRRLSGAILAQAEQARLALENAFRAWRNNRETKRYLLAGGALRQVLRHRGEFHWGEDRQEKQRFLSLSRSRRRRTRAGLVAIALLLTLFAGAGWQWNRWIGHGEDLVRWRLPKDLYLYQYQLETLVLDSSHLRHLNWVEQDLVRWLQGWTPVFLEDRLPPFGRDLKHLRVHGPNLVELGALRAHWSNFICTLGTCNRSNASQEHYRNCRR